MITALALEKMSLSEKIMTIEMIWEDISSNNSNISSPDWHENVLKIRDENIASGKDKLIDWEVAKQQLREATT